MEVQKGDIIDLMKQGKFDVAIQGCNCVCTQRSGLARQMVDNFQTDNSGLFTMEVPYFNNKPSINKLGTIDYAYFYVNNPEVNHVVPLTTTTKGRYSGTIVAIVNCYTQILPGIAGADGIPLDYTALRLCMRKVNAIFKDKTIAIPYLIGCGLAKGDESKVLNILEDELTDCYPTLIKL